MTAILLGLVGIFFPIGAAFVVIAIQEEDLKVSIILFILGAIFWGFGIYIWNHLRKTYENEKEEDNEKYALQLQVLDNIRTDIKTSIDNLVNEIRQDRNEQNNKPK